MTEIRSVASGSGSGVGVFATQSFQVGDVILKEDSPLVTLAPVEMTEEQLLSVMLITPAIKGKKKKGKKAKHNKSVQESLNNKAVAVVVPPTTICPRYGGKFRGMVLAAACYAQQQRCNNALLEKDSDVMMRNRRIQQLYHPDLSSPLQDDEKPIVEVAREALKYLQKRSKVGSPLHTLVSEQPDLVLDVMLVWSCNAFAGGRIYEKASRINHSCNPNAVVIFSQKRKTGEMDDDDNTAAALVVKAAAPIAVGEEISISYLGLFLYADGPVRQEQLLTTKHFTCQCTRCCQDETQPDIAASIPCPSCHKRHGRYLDEDVQYDDEHTVHYAVPPTAASTNKMVVCRHCSESLSLPTTGRNNPSHVLQLTKTVSDKIVSHLQDRDDAKKDVDTTDNKDELEVVEAEWEEQLLQLASTVVGARHWTTNLMLLLQLDRSLQTQHSNLLTNNGTSLPDLSQVAEGIDSLQRLCRFVDGLQLKLHMGHLLSNVVIGVARSLVSLGDVKSKKYASEWVSNIKDYTNNFESDGMKKVVATLEVAWERADVADAAPMEEEDEDLNQSSKKRAKTK